MERISGYRDSWHERPFPGPAGASPLLWSMASLLRAWAGDAAEDWRAEVTPAGAGSGGTVADSAAARALLAGRIGVADQRGSLEELFDGRWSGVEECPPIPAGHVAGHLYRDLLDTLVPAGLQHAAVAGYVPLRWTEEDLTADMEVGTFVFVGATATAVLDVDVTC